jgi:TRAP-type C4-dicarboxylate transport system permease small subunit
MSEATSLNTSGRILLVAFVLVLFWVGAWGLVEEVLVMVRKSIGISPFQLYLALVVGVVAIVLRYPQMLERF